MPQLNVGTVFTPQHANALASLAARGHVALPDIDAVLGAGLPGAGRAELLNFMRAIIPHAQTDVGTAAQELMKLVTAGPAGPHPWSQALPAGKTQAPVTMYGKRTDQDDGCHVPSRSGDVSISLTLHEGYVEYGNVRAGIRPDGSFSAQFNDKSGSFSGKIRGSVVEFSSVSRFQVRQGTRDFWSETRYATTGHAGGPGYTANADEVTPIRARALSSSSRAPFGLAFGLPVDINGQGDGVQRHGQGQLQGFRNAKGDRTIVALRDGRKEAAVVSGQALTTWQAQWTATDAGPLGYPVSDARTFTHQNRLITVQVFEGGYVFGDGTVEARSDAEAAFRTRFPEYRTPEEIKAKQNADFQVQEHNRQLRAVLAPVYALIAKRKAERAQGYTHRQPDDFESAKAWIQQHRPYDAAQLIDFLKKNMP